MRVQGIADIRDVRYAILEQNGKISFLKESDNPNIARTLIIDTHPDMQNITEAGLSIDWVKKQLNERAIPISSVFLMTVNETGAINIIEKEKKK